MTIQKKQVSLKPHPLYGQLSLGKGCLRQVKANFLFLFAFICAGPNSEFSKLRSHYDGKSGSGRGTISRLS